MKVKHIFRHANTERIHPKQTHTRNSKKNPLCKRKNISDEDTIYKKNEKVTHLYYFCKIISLWLPNSRGLPFGVLFSKTSWGCYKVVLFTWIKEMIHIKSSVSEGRLSHCLHTQFDQLDVDLFFCSWPNLSGWLPLKLILFKCSLQNTVLHINI